jgi:hypothetical protein
MTEIKGGIIKPYPTFIKDTFGEEAFNKWLEALPQESQDIYRKPILSSVWYPLKWASEEPMYKTIEMFYGGDVTKAVELGRYTADQAFKGVYKFLLKLFPKVASSSVADLTAQFQKTLSTFIRPVKVEGTGDKDHNNLRILEFPEINEALEYSLKGSLERSTELLLGKKPEIKITKSMARGDEYTEYDVQL